MVTGLQDSPALSGAPCPIMTLLPNNIILDIIRLADGGRWSHEVKLNKCLKELITWGTVEIESSDLFWGTSEYFSLWVTEAYAFFPLGARDVGKEYFPTDGIPFTNASWRHQCSEYACSVGIGGWDEGDELLEFAEEFRSEVWGVDPRELPVTNEYE